MAAPEGPCLNLVIVFDSSASLDFDHQNGYAYVKNFVTTLTKQYHSVNSSRTRNFGVVHFSDSAAILVPYDNYSGNVQTPLKLIEMSKHLDGATNVPQALEIAVEMVGNTPQSEYGIVFLTDGGSNKGGMSGDEKVKEVLESGHSFFAIFLSQQFPDEQGAMRGKMNDENELYLQTFQELENEENIRWALDKVCQPAVC